MKKTVWAFSFILALTAGSAIQTYALSSYKAMFNYEYTTTGTLLDSCNICHVNGSQKRNPYGRDFREAGRSFDPIEKRDSDGDGFDNISEIVSGTFPGDPDSKPTTQLPLPKGDRRPN